MRGIFCPPILHLQCRFHPSIFCAEMGREMSMHSLPHRVYYIHCPKNNRNLGTVTDPVLKQMWVRVRVYCMSGFWGQEYANKKSKKQTKKLTSTVYHCLRYSRTARCWCPDSDYFLDSVQGVWSCVPAALSPKINEYLQLYMYSFCAIFCTCGQKPKAGQIWFYYLYAENQIMFGTACVIIGR